MTKEKEKSGEEEELCRNAHMLMWKEKDKVVEEGRGMFRGYVHGSMSKGKEKVGEGWIEKLGTCSHWRSLSSSVSGDSSESSGNHSWASWDIPPPKKIMVCEIEENSGLDLSLTLSTPGLVFLANSSGVRPQDADYTYTFSLSEELELRILARFSLSDYWKLCQLNKTYLSLFKSGELFKIRRELGIRQLFVFTLASGDKSWWLFDERFEFRKRLPLLPSDDTFSRSDKETLCAGTHLLVVGWECYGHAVWRYELATNSWSRGPSMISPRSLFASATCGEFSFVAGGICGLELGVLNAAEKYNAETRSWEPLPEMNQRRKLCAGAYMDNQFYVVGGRNEQGEYLTCGEVLYEDRKMWVKIPGMLEDSMVEGSSSPPLIAVVKNKLYLISTSSNELKVYMKKSNTWKNLGCIPVRADFLRGWGVAFKSLGDKLLVMGRSVIHDRGDWMTIYTCRPEPNGGELEWNSVDVRQDRLRDFIYNCSIMAV